MSENVEGQKEQVEQPQVDVAELMARLEKLESTNHRLLEESKTYKTKYQSVQKEKEETERERLEKEGKFQELLDLEKNTAAKLKSEMLDLKKQSLRNTLKFEVAKHATDAYSVDDVIKCLPMDMIQMDEDELTFTGVQDAIAKLKEDKFYLFKNEKQTGMVSGRPEAVKPTQKTPEEMTSAERMNVLRDALSKI